MVLLPRAEYFKRMAADPRMRPTSWWKGDARRHFDRHPVTRADKRRMMARASRLIERISGGFRPRRFSFRFR